MRCIDQIRWQDNLLFLPVAGIPNGPWGVGMDGADHDAKRLLGITLDKVLHPAPIVRLGLRFIGHTTDPVNLFKGIDLLGRDVFFACEPDAVA